MYVCILYMYVFYMYVCLYECMYVFVCIYVCMYVCMYAFIYLCILVCMYVFYACMYVCMYVFYACLYNKLLISEYFLYKTSDPTLDLKYWVVETTPGTKLTKTINNVTPHTTLHFRVQARNVAGYGPLSEVVIYSPVTG